MRLLNVHAEKASCVAEATDHRAPRGQLLLKRRSGVRRTDNAERTRVVACDDVGERAVRSRFRIDEPNALESLLCDCVTDAQRTDDAVRRVLDVLCALFQLVVVRRKVAGVAAQKREARRHVSKVLARGRFVQELSHNRSLQLFCNSTLQMCMHSRVKFRTKHDSEQIKRTLCSNSWLCA